LIFLSYLMLDYTTHNTSTNMDDHLKSLCGFWPIDGSYRDTFKYLHENFEQILETIIEVAEPFAISRKVTRQNAVPIEDDE
jgi:hypothetical protein